MTKTVGFIGLGAMGWPMTARLAAQGYPMKVFDADPVNLAKTEEIDGIDACGNTRGVAEAADILFTCLPNDAVVRTVYLGREGLAEAMRPGTLTVDCSTVSPEVTRDVAARLAEKPVDHMDASMLGSVPQAEAGEIGFVVGGAPAAYDRLAPLPDILARATALPTPLLDQVVDLFRQGQTKGWGGEDFSAIAQLYAESLGRPLRDDPRDEAKDGADP